MGLSWLFWFSFLSMFRICLAHVCCFSLVVLCNVFKSSPQGCRGFSGSRFGTFLEPCSFNSASIFSSTVLLTFPNFSSGLSWFFGLSCWSPVGIMFLQFGINSLFYCLVAFCSVSKALLKVVAAFRALCLELFWNTSLSIRCQVSLQLPCCFLHRFKSAAFPNFASKVLQKGLLCLASSLACLKDTIAVFPNLASGLLQKGLLCLLHR